MTDYENDILNKIAQLYIDGKVSDDFMVSNLKQSAEMLNLNRLSDVEKLTGKSTQGLRKYHKDKIVSICGYQLFIFED
jgi:hypothetical protein